MAQSKPAYNKNIPLPKLTPVATQPVAMEYSNTGDGDAAGNGSPKSPSRRSFLKKGSILLAGGAVTTPLNFARSAHPYGSDTIKIGLVGCGGRGTGAAIQAMNSSGGDVRLVSMADVFEDAITEAFRSIKGEHPTKVGDDVQRFVGLDAFKGVMESDADLVILATAPGFRPLHFEAAVQAGKHCFMEKPVAADAPGVRRVLAANEIAKQKGLAVQVGLQRHHEFRYKETIARLHDGEIGDPILARAYWNGAGVWIRNRKPQQTETEYQIRNWYYFNWLSGDHINEQHIHNLDVINWVMKDYPVKAQGQGGRQVRTGSDTGQIFDHHMVEYTYGNGATMLSQCRHIPGCWNEVAEFVHGTKGWCDISGAKIYDHSGKLTWESEAKETRGGGWQQEHYDFFEELRKGNVPNEAEYGAKSTLTAIMGRMATYGGKIVKWDDCLNSNIAEADYDSITSFEAMAPVQPDGNGNYPVPVPGETKVV
jgi:myo-inositol 2-dehydrogenase/D-chiro-inositol 1-dehydrogenase